MLLLNRILKYFISKKSSLFTCSLFTCLKIVKLLVVISNVDVTKILSVY